MDPERARAASGFNPRIRKGCDANRLDCRNIKGVSIHASVKDATLAKIAFDKLLMFQSTHP